MSLNRRHVLKGMAVSSLAGWAMGDSVRALAGTPAPPVAAGARVPLLALVNEGAAGCMFVEGALAASRSPLQSATVGCDLAFMLDFERRLRSGRPLRVIGLLDDASATLIVDLARGAGARMRWLGQHTVEAGYGRHRLLDTELAEGCRAQRGGAPDACSASLHIRAERRGGAESPRRPITQPLSAAHSAEWASDLGYLLASADKRPAMPAPARYGGSAPDGSFVSFSIEA